MKNALVYRKASKADLADILRLYAQPELDDGNVLPLSEAEKLFERISSYPDYAMYVTLRDDNIVGTFALLIIDNLAHLGAPSAVIEDVAVDPEFQGQGIGKAMMQYALQICTRKGCYKAVVSSNRIRTKAHAFYESLPFKRHGYSFLSLLK